jgi:hypothetical protein
MTFELKCSPRNCTVIIIMLKIMGVLIGSIWIVQAKVPVPVRDMVHLFHIVLLTSKRGNGMSFHETNIGAATQSFSAGRSIWTIQFARL